VKRWGGASGNNPEGELDRKRAENVIRKTWPMKEGQGSIGLGPKRRKVTGKPKILAGKTRGRLKKKKREQSGIIRVREALKKGKINSKEKRWLFVGMLYIGGKEGREKSKVVKGRSQGS